MIVSHPTRAHYPFPCYPYTRPSGSLDRSVFHYLSLKNCRSPLMAASVSWAAQLSFAAIQLKSSSVSLDGLPVNLQAIDAESNLLKWVKLSAA